MPTTMSLSCSVLLRLGSKWLTQLAEPARSFGLNSAVGRRRFVVALLALVTVYLVLTLARQVRS